MVFFVDLAAEAPAVRVRLALLACLTEVYLFCITCSVIDPGLALLILIVFY